MVVIPCHNEPDIRPLLASLSACVAPTCSIELWWVVNHSAKAPDALKAQNKKTTETLRDYVTKTHSSFLKWGLLEAYDLPHKHAGVGLARKLGMDLAAARLQQVGRYQAPIINLDADCEVSANYFTALEAHFKTYPDTPGAALYYAHPLTGTLPIAHYAGITYYELFLRYYTHGLRYAGFPFGFQTVGSAMAVRANIYHKVGGMNRRKAGEDFYFLHKVIEQGHFSEVNTLTVKPSPRVSDRVPFGTGKAMADYFQDADHLHLQYPLDAFTALKQWVGCVPALYAWNIAQSETVDTLPEVQALDPALQTFLRHQNLDEKVRELKENTTHFESFEKRFFQWFNGFRVMKALHALRDAYGNAPLVHESQRLLKRIDPDKNRHKTSPSTVSANDLLEIYRQIDRNTEPFLLK